MKINSIQFLRAVAALLVVYCHAIDLQMGFTGSKQQNFFYLQNFGAIGVDIFFAISGFIITFVANKYVGLEDGINFLVKRFIRINPIYYIASLLYLIPLAWQYAAINRPISGPYLTSSLIDTLFILPLDGKGIYIPLLIIGWTLSFEWFFYLIFILLIFFKSNQKPLHISIALILLVILGRLFNVNDYRFTFATNPIMLEFIMGVIICWIYLNIEINKFIAYALIAIGITGYIYCIFWGYGDISEAGTVLSGVGSLKRFILWGIPSACLVGGCVFLEKQGKLDPLWNNRWSRLLGDASYSIYLIHLTVFALLTIGYRKLGYFPNGDLSILLHLTLAAFIGIVFFLKVERPLLNYLNRKQVVTKHKPLSAS